LRSQAQTTANSTTASIGNSFGLFDSNGVASTFPSSFSSISGCPSANTEHIVYIQFDNVHLRRDNPNVPSDLEQIPNLLNFLEDRGTLFTNHYTSLISHTSVGILTALTGVYGDKFGVSDRSERCGREQHNAFHPPGSPENPVPISRRDATPRGTYRESVTTRRQKDCSIVTAASLCFTFKIRRGAEGFALTGYGCHRHACR
jgi:hypothetical protein